MKDSEIVVAGTLPPPLGGATVLFKSFVEYLHSRAGGIVICDMARAGHLRIFFLAFLRPATRFVLFNLSSVRILQLAAAAVLASVFRKKFALRAFGGGWDVAFNELAPLLKLFCRKALSSASFLCFETKHQVTYFRSLGIDSVVWLPNSRDAIRISDVRAVRIGRFIYLGRICREKGVAMLLSAIERAGGDIEVDFFGPVEHDFDFQSVSGAKYCGQVAPEMVVDLLRGYTGLVLPTKWKGEGYPGVILEAFAAGIPVIASRWRAIPELFEGNEDLLFDVDNLDELISKMRDVRQGRVNVDGIVMKQAEALLQFDSKNWNAELLSLCRRAVRWKRD